jgi:hypothetical protein
MGNESLHLAIFSTTHQKVFFFGTFMIFFNFPLLYTPTH